MTGGVGSSGEENEIVWVPSGLVVIFSSVPSVSDTVVLLLLVLLEVFEVELVVLGVPVGVCGGGAT